MTGMREKVGTKKAIAKKRDVFIIAGALIAALFWLWPRIQLLIARPTEADMLHPAAVPLSYLNLVLFVVYAGALLKLSLRAGAAKYVHLVLLFIMTVFVLIDDIEFILHYVVPTAETDAQLLRSPAMWWNLSGGIRWLLWFAFNAWYFIWRRGKPNH